MYHPSQMSGPQSPPIQPGPPGGMQHHYPPPPGSEAPHEAQTSNQYPQYSYDIQLKFPPQQHQQHQQQENQHPNQQYNTAHGLPLPPMSAHGLPPPNHQYAPMPPREQMQISMDTTGQTAPPGMKPKVTATLWEDEGTLCFQVDVKGTCVARREDNHMINGTKLLNVAGMTRGRRDGILKAEKQKHVVKIGPMHLKGVWIPFERALEFANKEKITELLYPLFVHNIGSLLYHPVNSGHSGRFPGVMVGGSGGNGGNAMNMMRGPEQLPNPLHEQQQQQHLQNGMGAEQQGQEPQRVQYDHYPHQR
ncbi:Cell pattern formation-associated protein [Lachnellula hyalina]|uniref:Cell pattern formation-associated protein n=1 Tax=Lachnellula hyalina TaxID=1316788 RepID=A0A8H8RCG1_9HELO|nr:Cell pattern formation-associated protein [Lachnellula hyalina]TVY30817.1 Cell pattern formation-associated protein [Lachnellula hyalina]